MTLADLRRFAIRRQTKVRFPLRNGMECVITEHGVAQAPGLKTAPDFNFESELASAREFVLETAEPAKGAAPRRTVDRDELEGMLVPAAAGASSHEEE